MLTLPQLLEKLALDTTVRVALPIVDSNEKLRLTGVYHPEEGDQFTIVFPLDTLPVERIDKNRKCAINVNVEGQTYLLLADILEIKGKRTMRLIGREVVVPEQSREYFRVDVATPVAAASIIPEELADDGSAWRITGETIDVSGNGLLAAFNKPIEDKGPVRIELVLPQAKPEIIHALAHIVRTTKINDDTYHIAFHFDELSTEDQDKIMATCFGIQRRNLRLKVRVRDSE
ncbi:PilZ domain-containing protein [Desulfolithobacter sp.]